jgi:uncharacterized membrane protein YkgB
MEDWLIGIVIAMVATAVLIWMWRRVVGLSDDRDH